MPIHFHSCLAVIFKIIQYYIHQLAITQTIPKLSSSSYINSSALSYKGMLTILFPFQLFYSAYTPFSLRGVSFTFFFSFLGWRRPTFSFSFSATSCGKSILYCSILSWQILRSSSQWRLNGSFYYVESSFQHLAATFVSSVTPRFGYSFDKLPWFCLKNIRKLDAGALGLLVVTFIFFFDLLSSHYLSSPYFFIFLVFDSFSTYSGDSASNYSRGGAYKAGFYSSEIGGGASNFLIYSKQSWFNSWKVSARRRVTFSSLIKEALRR